MNTVIEYACVQSVSKTLQTTEHVTYTGILHVWCLQEGKN